MLLKSLSASEAQTDLKKIPYPIAVICTTDVGRHYGQAAVWVSQVSYDPVMFYVALGHTRNTPRHIRTWSPISINYVTDLDVVWHFGRQSGKVVDKFVDFKDWSLVSNVPVLDKSTIAIVGTVVGRWNAGTHDVFEVMVDKVLKGEGEFLTYQYGSV